jgi:hypothetical protein
MKKSEYIKQIGIATIYYNGQFFKVEYITSFFEDGAEFVVVQDVKTGATSTINVDRIEYVGIG